MSVPPSAEASGVEGVLTESFTATLMLTPTIIPLDTDPRGGGVVITKNFESIITLIPKPSLDANDPLVSIGSISHLKHHTTK